MFEPARRDDPDVGVALLDGQHVHPVHVDGLVADVAQPPGWPVAAVLRVRARTLAALGPEGELHERHRVEEVLRPGCGVVELHGHEPDRGVAGGEQADLARAEAPRDPVASGRHVNGRERL